MKNDAFVSSIWKFYSHNKRDLPWRNTKDPYRILVSEIMLQQTQVERVLKKYPEFVKSFPNFKTLAQSSPSKILEVWQGMGYNRRALYLQKTASVIQEKFDGKLPDDPSLLQTFPGIGFATARSIVVFSFNKPHAFIETNIRRVFIHEFFKNENNVSDKEILQLVEATLDKENPREWLYALMDYGSYLGKVQINPNRRSAHYVKQSKFEGSLRQIRGRVVKLLVQDKTISLKSLKKEINDERLDLVLGQLQKEGFLKISRGKLSLR